MNLRQLIQQAEQYGQFLPTPVTSVLSLWVPVGTNSREKVYFEQPGWWNEDYRVIRMQLLARQNADMIDPLTVLDSTITIANTDDQLIMDGMPLRRLSMDFAGFPGNQYRCLPLYEPFKWDPIRSYVQSWKGFPNALEVRILVDYVTP